MDLKALDFFGNIELIYHTPRMQTLISNKVSYALKFSKTCFYNHFSQLNFNGVDQCIEFFKSLSYFDDLGIQEIINLAMKSSLI
jgi:hypothetical protein